MVSAGAKRSVSVEAAGEVFSVEIDLINAAVFRTFDRYTWLPG